MADETLSAEEIVARRERLRALMKEHGIDCHDIPYGIGYRSYYAGIEAILVHILERLPRG